MHFRWEDGIRKRTEREKEAKVGLIVIPADRSVLIHFSVKIRKSIQKCLLYPGIQEPARTNFEKERYEGFTRKEGNGDGALTSTLRL